jgi:hypothetical protein
LKIKDSQLEHDATSNGEDAAIAVCLGTDSIWESDGAQRRIRTTDTRIFSPLLYQLSYLGLFRQTKTRTPDFIDAPWGAP